MGELSRALAKLLHETGRVKSPEVAVFTGEELDKYSLVGSSFMAIGYCHGMTHGMIIDRLTGWDRILVPERNELD